MDIDMIGIPASPAGFNSRSALLYALRSAFANSDKPVYFSTDIPLVLGKRGG